MPMMGSFPTMPPTGASGLDEALESGRPGALAEADRADELALRPVGATVGTEADGRLPRLGPAGMGGSGSRTRRSYRPEDAAEDEAADAAAMAG